MTSFIFCMMIILLLCCSCINLTIIIFSMMLLSQCGLFYNKFCYGQGGVTGIVPRVLY